MTLKSLYRHAAAALSALILVGCAQPVPPLYQWGSYEGQVYAMYIEPGKASPEDQLIRLEADLQRARAAQKAMPPGFHAHMGYLYFQLGKRDQALGSLRTEAALFPESKVYMDRLIARISP
jgi:hypothetical protein